jgi:L-amino acid N-acyltransferase YncA
VPALPIVRLARDEDVPALVDIYAPIVRDTPISFELVPPSEAELRSRVHAILEKTPWLVCAEGPTVWGYAYAGPFRARPAYQWAVEATVYVAEDHRGKGVARALYTALFGGLRLLAYRRVYAGITLPNPASVRTHEALGFTPVGVFKGAGYKLGAWHDVGFWQLSLGHETAPATPPRPLGDILDLPAWREALQQGAACLDRGQRVERL